MPAAQDRLKVPGPTKAEAGAVHPHLISSVGDQIPAPRCRDLPKAQTHRAHRMPGAIHTDRVTAA
jgi:hypothetical protein